jgi:DNA-binding GntR family transcriptional regulator
MTQDQLMNLPRIDNTNLLDKAYLILKERIIRREFKPNQKLSIPELANQLGVSRTPVRDALNRLEKDGLIKTVSKVGTFVAAIEIQDVLDIIDTRLMLEFWAVEKAQMLSDSELERRVKQLEGMLGQASVSFQKMPLESYLKRNFNLQFHLELIKLDSNKRNVALYKDMMNYHSLSAEYSLFTEEMVSTAMKQHCAIVESLKQRNLTELKSAIKLHLDDSKERLIKRMRDNGGQI